MNTNTPPPERRRGWIHTTVLGALAVVLGALFVAPLLIPAAIYLSFRPTGDLRTLHHGVVRSTGLELETQIELAVRPLVFTLARAGATVSSLPSEARAALRTIRGLEVGLYQVTSNRRWDGTGSVLAELDRRMAERGWDRIVGVVEGREVVAVFAPQKLASARDLSLAVVVLDGAQLVVASVRGNPEALVELALDQARANGIPRLALRR